MKSSPCLNSPAATIKERPLLFSGPMVRAILAGRKTQTRRVVKYLPQLGFPGGWCAAAKAEEPGFAHIVGDYRRFCPYGQPVDRLWVKETFFHVDDFHGKETTWFRADYNTFPGQWKPSIFMPRVLSRITLEIVAVRVERLNDISEADALAEGIVECWEGSWHWEKEVAMRAGASPVEAYQTLWESINGPGSWALNPWVWVIEFHKL